MSADEGYNPWSISDRVREGTASQEDIKEFNRLTQPKQNVHIGKYYGDQIHWNDPFNEEQASIEYVEKYDNEAKQYRIIYYHYGQGINKVLKVEWNRLGVLESDYHEIIKENGKWRYVQDRKSHG
jgi:hydroxymethylpyrimidine pyrophosphatase-like HAD family hydrolase